VSAGEAFELVAGGTRRALGRPVSAGNVLDVSGIAGIVSYEPAELVLTARAGTPMHVIEAALAERSQMLAFEPPDLSELLGAGGSAHSESAGHSAPDASTFGGTVATGLSGPRRFRGGGVRDHVLGVVAVSGRGESFVGGGKVVKNVTGYDIPKLMTGSYGTLAVLTEITVKVLPAPEDVRTLLVAIRGAHGAGRTPDATPTQDAIRTQDAVRAMTRVLQSTADVSGACYLPAGIAAPGKPSDESVLAFRLEGFTPSVDFRLSALRESLAPAGAQSVLDREASSAFWRAVRDVQPFIDANTGSVWRLSVPPSEGAAVVERIERSWPDARWFLDWGGGLIWLATRVAVPADPPLASQRGSHANVAHAGVLLREALGATGGHATLIRAPTIVRANVDVFHPQPAEVAALSKRVKAQFDPSRVLNPGRMYANV
jgi:glycolate dehydrogenase FAD-binding subunit